MNYFPVFLSLQGRKCVLVGGGKVASRKFSLLHRAGAEVSIVSPVLCESLAEAVSRNQASHVATSFRAEHLDGAHIVIAATQRESVNQAVAAAANAKCLPVNVVDAPELCTFIMPAIVDRSPIIVAISSGGSAPVLARRIRQRIEALLPIRLGDFARWSGDLRRRVQETVASAKRRDFWERLNDSDAMNAVTNGRIEVANGIVRKLLRESEKPLRGRVLLVGAGPGDPELLTLKGLRALQSADVVVHDRLVGQEIIDLARRDAERIDVGKSAHHHTMPQAAINRLLVRLANEGKTVCRLKGGDPYIFGRGGEEVELLAQSGIEFEVIPGITAMSGCAAAAAIPLTHRDYSATVQIVAGHRCRDENLDCDWTALARPAQTIVFYMGLSGLASICRNLRDAGAKATLPVAIIERGATLHQRIVVGTLATITEKVKIEAITSPALIVIGDVVALRESLLGSDAPNSSLQPFAGCNAFSAAAAE